MSYSSAEEQIVDQQPVKEKCFKLAKVESLTETGTPIIRFYGEEDASGKNYKFLASYEPKANDTILVSIVNDTCVILGKITSSVETIDYITEEELNTAITDAIDALSEVYAAKTHMHNYLGSTTTSSRVEIMFGNSGYLFTNDSNWGMGSSTYPWKNGHFADFVNVGGKRLQTDRIYAGNSYSSNFLIMESATLLRPSSNGSLNLGSSSYKLNTIYASTGTINTSDKRQKKKIQGLTKKYKDFFMKLNPKRFMYRNGTSGRFHTGFIAQDIETAMEECGINDKEFAGFIKSPIYSKKDKDGNYDTSSDVVGFEYGLRYSEFIALNTMMIQDLVKDNEELKKRVEALERKINE